MSKYAMIKLPDDFEKGNCKKCPISHIGEDFYGNYIWLCPFHSSCKECPLEIREEEEEIFECDFCHKEINAPNIMPFSTIYNGIHLEGEHLLCDECYEKYKNEN